MFESIYWPLQNEPRTTRTRGDYEFPSFDSKSIQLNFYVDTGEVIPRQHLIFPFLHNVMSCWTVYEFSKVEKKIVANRRNSCKGSQCNRVDPVTNPLNSGVTL